MDRQTDGQMDVQTVEDSPRWIPDDLTHFIGNNKWMMYNYGPWMHDDEMAEEVDLPDELWAIYSHGSG